MKARIYLLCLLIFVAGCSSKIKSKTAAVNPQTGEVLKNSFGMVVYDEVNTPVAAAISKNSADKVKYISTNSSEDKNGCALMLEVATTTAAGEAEKFRSFNDCMSSTQTKDLVAVALGRPTTDIEAVEQQTTNSIAATERARVDITSAVSGATRETALIAGVASVFNRNSKDRARVAADNGNVSTGDIYMSSPDGSAAGNEAGLAQSNDAEAGGEGTPGTATGTGGDVLAGDAPSSTVNNQLILGNGNNTGMTTGEGTNLSGTTASQSLGASANAAINADSNVDQQPVVDSASNVDFNNDPCVGTSNCDRSVDNSDGE